MYGTNTREDPATSLDAQHHAVCLLQMMIVSEPTMVTQALDRQLYPEFIDKPSLYSIINQVQAFPISSLASSTIDSFRRAQKCTVPRKGVTQDMAAMTSLDSSSSAAA